jgi:hypothetical protein
MKRGRSVDYFTNLGAECHFSKLGRMMYQYNLPLFIFQKNHLSISINLIIVKHANLAFLILVNSI